MQNAFLDTDQARSLSGTLSLQKNKMGISEYYNKIEGIWKEVGQRVKKYSEVDRNLLNRKPGPDKWSALECIDHLCKTYETYMPNLEKAFQKYPDGKSEKYKPGLFGNLIVKNVGLKDDKSPKMPMKTFSFFEPENTALINTESVISDFLTLHQRFLDFIERSHNKNINRVRVKSAAGSWLKLRLGVCFLFLLNHELRHLAQADKAIDGH